MPPNVRYTSAIGPLFTSRDIKFAGMHYHGALVCCVTNLLREVDIHGLSSLLRCDGRTECELNILLVYTCKLAFVVASFFGAARLGVLVCNNKLLMKIKIKYSFIDGNEYWMV